MPPARNVLVTSDDRGFAQRFGRVLGAVDLDALPARRQELRARGQRGRLAVRQHGRERPALFVERLIAETRALQQRAPTQLRLAWYSDEPSSRVSSRLTLRKSAPSRWAPESVDSDRSNWVSLQPMRLTRGSSVLNR